MFRPEVLWTSLLITTAAVGGLLYSWTSTTKPEPPAAVVADDETSPELEDESRGLSLTIESDKELRQPSAVPVDSLRNGDQLLVVGNYIGAYQHYAKLNSEVGAAIDGGVLVRLGLASELSGFHDQGETHYRDAIQSTSTTALQKAWALIGTARIWESQGRLDEAIGLLSELFLSYGSQEYPVELRLPINRCLADFLQKRYLQSRSASDPAPLYFWCETRIEPIISDAVRFPEQADVEPSKLEVVQRPIDDASLIMIDARLTLHPMLQLIGELSSAVQLEFRLSPDARSVLAGRSIHVQSTAMPVSVLLDQTLGSLDLVWSQVGATIFVSHRDESKPESNRQFELDRIQRVLRQLQLNFPNSIERVAALMHDGNNAVLRSDLAAAANKYQAAREQQPAHELSAMLYFNSAALDAAHAREEPALDNFYRALDQTVSPRLQASAFARIAELELELGRPSQAIPAASRGMRLSKDPALVSQNLMILAKSYLLEEDPFSANRILFNNATALSDPARKRLASVVSSYARFQAVRPVRGLQNEGERLVSALAALQPADPQNFVDHLIISRAFFDVGFRSKAIEHLAIAAGGVAGGYWDSRIRFELASNFYRAGELTKASDALAAITQADDDSLRAKILLMDARIQLELTHVANCQASCRALLKLPLDDDSKKTTLELLGKSYQQDGKHYAAALCFAGLLPEAATSDPL